MTVTKLIEQFEEKQIQQCQGSFYKFKSMNIVDLYALDNIKEVCVLGLFSIAHLNNLIDEKERLKLVRQLSNKCAQEKLADVDPNWGTLTTDQLSDLNDKGRLTFALIKQWGI